MDNLIESCRMVQGQKLDVIQFISPLTAFVRQSWFQTFLVLAGFVLISNSCFVCLALRGYGLSNFRIYRLQFLSSMLQDDNISSTAAIVDAISTLTLTKVKCDVASQNFTFVLSRTADEPYLTEIVSNQTLLVNGFSISTRLAAPASIVGRFLLQGSNDNRAWTSVCSSSTRFATDGVRFLDQDSAIEFLGTKHYDCSSPWPLLLEAVVDPVLFAVCLICTATAGALNRQLLARRVVASVCALLFLNGAAASAGYLALGLQRESFGPVGPSLGYLIMSLSLVLDEPWFFDAMLVTACLGITSTLVQSCAIFSDCSYAYQEPPIKHVVLFVLSASFLLIRARYLRAAMAAVGTDRARYDAEWARFIATSENREALHRLWTAADLRAQDCPADPPRQCNRTCQPRSAEPAKGGSVHPSFGAWAKLTATWGSLLSRRQRIMEEEETEEEASGDYWRTVPGTVDSGARVDSLDQLYAQARHRAMQKRLGDACFS